MMFVEQRSQFNDYHSWALTNQRSRRPGGQQLLKNIYWSSAPKWAIQTDRGSQETTGREVHSSLLVCGVKVLYFLWVNMKPAVVLLGLILLLDVAFAAEGKSSRFFHSSNFIFMLEIYRHSECKYSQSILKEKRNVIFFF